MKNKHEQDLYIGLLDEYDNITSDIFDLIKELEHNKKVNEISQLSNMVDIDYIIIRLKEMIK